MFSSISRENKQFQTVFNRSDVLLMQLPEALFLSIESNAKDTGTPIGSNDSREGYFKWSCLEIFNTLSQLVNAVTQNAAWEAAQESNH